MESKAFYDNQNLNIDKLEFKAIYNDEEISHETME